MREIKRTQFSKGGQGGGYTIKVPIPKQMADAIGITQDDPEVMITLESNKIVIEKGEEEMKNFKFEMMAEKNGTVEFEGKEYALTQQAYISGTIEDPYYEAMAVDQEENEYMVRWEIVREVELEEDACDWYAPQSVERM